MLKSDRDLEFLRRAVALSGDHVKASDSGPFGAVIVRDGEIIAEGWNQVTKTNDPTAHAEMVAIRIACKKIENFSLAGCVIYSSCEPCPMCLSAIYWARLDRLVYANSRGDAAAIGFDDDFLYREVVKPVHERAIATTKHDLPEALDVFADWAANPNKIPY